MSTAVEWYNVVSKYYLVVPALVFGPYFFFDAPFGRFSPSKSSRLVVDGIKSWIVMEIVSPICFLTAFLSSPLTRPLSSLQRFPLSPPPLYSQTSLAGIRIWTPNAPTILALLFLCHYTNRALISPLRTPVRSKSHIIVPMSGILVNIVNGSLMGAFLSALATPVRNSGFGAFLNRETVVSANWTFWTGVTMWCVGCASNIWHDEILLDIRRKAKDGPASDKREDRKPEYGIPRGGLYGYISYPNYASEWIEWLGFAIACTGLTKQVGRRNVVFPFVGGRVGLGWMSETRVVEGMTPAWLFLIAEVFFMFPRAWSGHRWYQRRFAEYPRERRAVIPYLL